MKTKLFVAIATLSVILASCKRREIETTPLASLIVTNVVNNGGNLVLGTNAASTYNNYFQGYSIKTGNKQIKLVDTAGGIKKVYYDRSADLVNGGLYSLFLTGTPEAVESVFVKEENIVPHKENVFGVRVVNLSTENLPISVNIAGAANGSLIPTLSYKNLSDFKKVAATTSQTLEFRNAATGILITTFDVPDYDIPRFRNITFAFAGAVGSEHVIRINNY